VVKSVGKLERLRDELCIILSLKTKHDEHFGYYVRV